MFNILRNANMKLKENLQPVLELESGSNDPMAYVITIVLIQCAQQLFEPASGIDIDYIRMIGNALLTFFLQLGIGAIPDAVLLFLKEKNDLGIHTEMFSDGVVELVEAGVITNKAKTLHRGQSVATFLMGTRRLYDYVNNNPAVAMYPVDYVNDPYVIGQNDNLVSINSCVQVDIMGQVVSTSAGLRQISGVGGQVDFVRGANLSKGGRAIMAMPSTTGKGKISKIVPFLDQGSAVTTTRNEVNYVITEYGIAKLKGKSLRQRAEALIRIAHPDFRDELTAEFRRRYPRDY